MSGPLKASWEKVAEDDVLKRSSHAVAAIDAEVYVFGGELVARQPIDGDVHAVAVDGDSPSQPRTLTSSSQTPTPRVGASMVALNKTLYIFSGRGGTDMSALLENDGLWTFIPTSSTWSFSTPTDPSAPFPEARSYHSATSDGDSTLYIHAGCPASGRLRDFWSFDVRLKVWTRLPDAPGPQRGGTSLCFTAGKVWRMGGFDGKEEIGGVVDFFDLASGKWESFNFHADGERGPGARSVAALLPLVVNGRDYLVTVFGEADPSSLGHAGAGKMLEDIWVLDVEERKWLKLEVAESGDGKPAPRGWFGATVLDESTLAVVGGLGEDNERLGDAWTLKFA